MMGAGLIAGFSVLYAFITIILICTIPSKWKNYATATSILMSFVSFSILSVQVLISGTIEFSFYAGTFLGNIPVMMDPLAAWFVLIINFTCVTGFFYGTAYLKKYENRNSKLNLHWISFILFQLSMIWVCMFHHAFAFLVSWEIMSLSSMMLVIFEHEKPKNIRAGINYFVQMHISVAFLIVAFIWLYFLTGSFQFQAYHNLAYCTIENIGIIGIGLGLGLIGLGTHSNPMIFLGFGGALLHTLNHSLFKSMLFFSAGSVYQQTHTRDMDKLGGIHKYMPKTTLLFLAGSMAICGLPPFNGFVSEFILYNGLIEGFQYGNTAKSLLTITGFAGLSIIGGISVFAFTKTFGTIFLGRERTKLVHKPQEVSTRMLIPQYFIFVAMLGIAFFPDYFMQVASKCLSVFNVSESTNASYASTFENLRSLNLYFILFIGVISIFWLLRQMAIKKLPQKQEDTWGCGYLAGTPKIQYTGKSFTKPLSKILNFLLVEEKHYLEIKNGSIFPAKRTYGSFYRDFFEHRLIDPVIQRIVFTTNYFKFIQNGRIQSYVIYGITFILIIFIFTFFYFNN